VSEPAVPVPGLDAVRARGQVWTPDDVADAMAAWALAAGAREVLDPAVGAGALLRAARRVGGPEVALTGIDPDPVVLDWLGRSGLDAQLDVADYTRWQGRAAGAVLVNPPYLRHHRLAADKPRLRALGESAGLRVDGRAGLHVYVLVKAVHELPPGGRLAFLVSSDVCEGAVARTLWPWVHARVALDAVLTFTPDAAPFPGADTNAVLLLLRHGPPPAEIVWAEVDGPGRPALRAWLAAGPHTPPPPGVRVALRTQADGLATGWSRPPQAAPHRDGLVLGDLADVHRGIATGANAFFLRTARQLRAVPEAWRKRCIARVRDLPDGPLTTAHLDALAAKGRPTWLLDIPPEPPEALPAGVRRLLATAERAGIAEGALLARRKPWWKMERREPPPILFAYLGRTACRFVANPAGAVPLTGLTAVYPKPGVDAAALLEALNHPATLAGLAQVGKRYGRGAIKVEPGGLLRLPIAGPSTLISALRPR
jgi:adenine-specific DNA-methyltransferase